jgi:23S rRNA (cytosine1962-C5)-methyltransferase
VDRSEYALIDCGDGRRLERFGARLVDRPAPGAGARRRDPAAWAAADLVFDLAGGWRARDPASLDPWMVRLGAVTLELRTTDSGQVGLFPEHAGPLAWLAERLVHAPHAAEGLRVLNLFAYTGLATLALAAKGAGVTHVDAQRSAIAWARRNAAASGLADRPVRWIVDDALAFTEREARRGRRYDAIVLDPPTYGHAGGRAWVLERDLTPLLEACARVATEGAPILLTAHAADLTPAALGAALEGAFPARGTPAVGPLVLRARSGAILELGALARAG